jgi:hypothetical protein
LGGIFREFAVIAGDFRDVQAGFFAIADDDFIARRIDGKAKDIVAASDVGDGGWGENADFSRIGHKEK